MIVISKYICNALNAGPRSEERRVGKECCDTWGCRGGGLGDS